MGASRERMTSERLFEATEAALRAATEQALSNRGFSPYPADLVGMPEQPTSLEGFTKVEIEEACAFLVRLGVLSKPRRV